MAVAGLQNVSAFSPSLFRESRPGNRASSVLQMWRELEGDNVVSPRYRSRQQTSGPGSECFSTTTSVGQRSENGDDNSDTDVIENRGPPSLEMDHGDNNSIISEQSSDLGDTERERVRQVFREWMNSNGKGCFPNRFHSGTEWRGENERERVRITREWAQMNDQCESLGNGVAEDGSEIEQVRHDIGGRRPIRRLCGRQTLLDLLLRAHTEREIELQGLSERRPVSDFAHRNRIQALLRGRFLRNQRLVPEEKPSSFRAATEICLLRQRQTVSDLREGFLSKFDNCASTSMNTAESDSSFGDEMDDESESPCKERDVTVIHPPSDLHSDVDGNSTLPESSAQVSEIQDPVACNNRTEQELSVDLVTARNMDHAVLAAEAIEHINDTIDSSLETDNIVYSGGLREVSLEHLEPRSDNVHEEVDLTPELEGNDNDEFSLPNTSEEVEGFQEPAVEVEDSVWPQLTSVASTEWVDGNRENTDRSWQEMSTDQWIHEQPGNDAVNQDRIQESRDEWPSHDLQEAIDSWLDIPSGEVASSVGRTHTLYFPDDDDDNVRSIEIRELFSRRRVSGLLRSSFRDSLDQVLQSHMERQGHASAEWESENTFFSPALPEQEQEQLSGGDQTLAISDDSDSNLFAPNSTIFRVAEPLWHEYLQGSNWPHNLDHQPGTEWEVINELRINLAGLQQRMNSMQSMLEACMEMQMELQRTVRQEVSAALNRSILSRDAGASKGGSLNDESRWDQVRRGICCLCSDSNIDSLLYRCGHICTCSKCAEKLVECSGKCPMCQAPVVEMVRAYFTQ